MENQENNNGQLQIELKEEVAQGTYANLAIITHSSSEFILDFIRVMPGMPKAGVQSRIVLAPEHAKRLLRALEENIGKYERAFGLIRMPDEQIGKNKVIRRLCFSGKSYRFLIGIYATSSSTFLYAGRMMRLPSKFSSSLRCAHQPTIRAMANSGVKISCGKPIISYTKPE